MTKHELTSCNTCRCGGFSEGRCEASPVARRTMRSGSDSEAEHLFVCRKIQDERSEAIYCQTQTTPCHAELVSASQTLNEKKTLKRVQGDKTAHTHIDCRGSSSLATTQYELTPCNPRHCERSEAIQGSTQENIDCRGSSSLATTQCKMTYLIFAVSVRNERFAVRRGNFNFFFTFLLNFAILFSNIKTQINFLNI